jgi:hypothetical protein
MKRLLFLCLIIVNYNFVIAQKPSYAQISYKYIVMPQKKLPENTKTYQTKVDMNPQLFGGNIPHITKECDKFDLKGFQKVKANADILIEISILNTFEFKNVKTISEEYGTPKEGEQQKYKYKYEVQYLEPKLKVVLKKKDGGVFYESNGEISESTTEYGIAKSSSNGLGLNVIEYYLSEDELKSAWERDKSKFLADLKSASL